MTIPRLVKDDALASKFEYINSSSGLSFIKDIYSIYQGMSTECAKILGWKSPAQGIYKTDYDIPSENSAFAADYIKQDQLFFVKNCKVLTLEIIPTYGRWLTLLVEKIPLVNKDGYLVGTHGYAFDVSDINKYNYVLASHDQRIVPSSKKAKIYTLNPELSPLPLTTRQQECVFFLIRGKTTKQIAEILNLSARTVESYFEAIKYRLDCTHKSQIIEKAIDSGFLYYIPENLLKRDVGQLVM